mmetsp:Transcript_33744/g.44516  ORF Transcript_33744/g.44516 Transcript_33744/m.44516 type:complete len:90 (-) Transcript_33744:885-1154(-)
MDEAERALLGSPLDDERIGRDSNLLDSIKIGDSTPGQRELDSDEMNEEMMDEHVSQDDYNLVQPGWKISDSNTPTQGEQNDDSESTEPS